MYGKKPLQYCKVISLQLIKINGKKIASQKKINNLKLPHTEHMVRKTFSFPSEGFFFFFFFFLMHYYH